MIGERCSLGIIQTGRSVEKRLRDAWGAWYAKELRQADQAHAPERPKEILIKLVLFK